MLEIFIVNSPYYSLNISLLSAGFISHNIKKWYLLQIDFTNHHHTMKMDRKFRRDLRN